LVGAARSLEEIKKSKKTLQGGADNWATPQVIEEEKKRPAKTYRKEVKEGRGG